MKKIFVSAVLISLLMVPAVNVLAQESPPADLDVMEVLEQIVDWLFTILLVIAAISIIIAAYYFVTAAGNPETVSKARNFVLYALIGVAVAVASRGLVSLVRTIVGE
jgi:phosphoglycerol transferase MdoB-like AlkP superfamily enzyme